MRKAGTGVHDALTSNPLGYGDWRFRGNSSEYIGRETPPN